MHFLDERLSDIDKHLADVLRHARTSTRHRGIRGNELAGALGNSIQDHYNECTSRHENCEVRDTHGHQSQEVDLVLLNRFHPKIQPRATFIEGVIAAAEVKAVLDKSKMIDCLQKAQQFKRLKPTVEGTDLQAHSVEAEDWQRFLLRRPFFAFAYEDKRDIRMVQQNIEEWVSDNKVPDVEQIDAVFVLNKGIIFNFGAGTGVIEKQDANGSLLSGFVWDSTQTIFSQMMVWLHFVCPSFTSLTPILPKYTSFRLEGFTK